MDWTHISIYSHSFGTWEEYKAITAGTRSILAKKKVTTIPMLTSRYPLLSLRPNLASSPLAATKMDESSVRRPRVIRPSPWPALVGERTPTAMKRMMPRWWATMPGHQATKTATLRANFGKAFGTRLETAGAVASLQCALLRGSLSASFSQSAMFEFESLPFSMMVLSRLARWKRARRSYSQ